MCFLIARDLGPCPIYIRITTGDTQDKAIHRGETVWKEEATPRSAIGQMWSLESDIWHAGNISATRGATIT